MATIDKRTNSKGEIVSYRVRTCVGRDEQYKQVWRTVTIPRPEGLTPKAEEKEVKRQVDAWEQSVKEDYARSHSKEDKARITFADFVQKHWWTDHVMDGTHTPSSIAFYGYMSDDILKYFGDKVKLSSIDAEAVKRYVKYLNTKAVTKRGEPYSKTTIQHHFGTLRNVLQYARRFHYIAADPTQDLTQKEKPHRDAKKVDFLDSKNAKRFMDCLNAVYEKGEKKGEYLEPLFWRCFMNVLMTCGLRRGECIGLQWRDIDPDKLTLTVERNVTMDANSDNKLRIGSTKTGESRTVPITPRVYDLLMQLKREHEERFNMTMAPGAFIFCREYDPQRPIYPTEPTRWQRKFIEKHKDDRDDNGKLCPLPSVSPHDLRHTAATLAIEAGASLKEVQELLGHKDPSTTMAFYTGVSEEAQRRTVEGIESLIVTGT